VKLPRDFTDISLITCDIFDTLLVRDSVTPRRLWNRNGRWFSFARVGSEFAARVLARFQDKKEIGIANIYQLLPSRWSIDDEINLEITALRLNPEIGDWLMDASDARVRIVLISDIYLSAPQIAKIMSAIGAPMYEIVTSSDEGVTKSTGLFETLQKRWNTAPSEWIHVGDNWKADVLTPNGLGIRTVHYPKLLDQIQAEGVLSKRGAERVLKTGVGGQKLITQLSLQYVRLRSDNRESTFGVGVLVGALVCAPIAKAIAKYVAGVAKQNNSQVVWFTGRDGWLPFVFFEREKDTLPSAYFSVSRVAVESIYFEIYLDQMIQKQHQVLIFDIGWRGSLLTRVRRLHPEISWVGAFVALIGAPRSYEYAMAKRFSRNWISLVRNRDLIETLFSDPTPGVLSYDSAGRPALKVEHDELNHDLRHAVLKGAQLAIEASTQELSLDLALTLARVTGSYPSRKLAERFLGVSHEIVENRRKLFVVKSWRDLYRVKDLSWWAGAHAMRSTNRLVGYCWDIALYSLEISVLISRVCRRYVSRLFRAFR
jgi:FMN phosphatase YigB (HAD superfamily)